MDLARPAKRLGPRLRQPEMAHLAGVDQARHGADGVLDRHLGVDPVQIVDVDDIGLQALEALLARHRHIFGPPVIEPPALAGMAAQIAELRLQHHLVALSL